MNSELDGDFAEAEQLIQPFGRTLYQVVKGSTLYGLPGTHADVDIRSVFLAPTCDMLSIRGPQHTVERMVERDDAVPLDVVAWEVKRFLHHLLGHNGNFIEMLLVPEEFAWMSEEGRTLRALGPRFITKKLCRYYRGFALNQFKRSNQQMKTGKGMLYTYREMYAGIIALREGRVIFPWQELRDRVEPALFRSEVLDDIVMDRTHAPAEMLGEMDREFKELNRLLDQAHAESSLPPDFDGYEVCNNALLLWRSRGWLP